MALGSSSSVVCEFPERVRGKDLKELKAENFWGCLGSESLHQINVHQLPSGDRAHPRDHPPLHSSMEKGKRRGDGHSLQAGQRPGYRKPSKNCTKSRSRTKAVPLVPWKNAEEVQDYEHKSNIGMLPKQKSTCPQTRIQPPSGVQQAAGGTRSTGVRAAGAGRAALMAWLLVLVVIIR